MATTRVLWSEDPDPNVIDMREELAERFPENKGGGCPASSPVLAGEQRRRSDYSTFHCTRTRGHEGMHINVMGVPARANAYWMEGRTP